MQKVDVTEVHEVVDQQFVVAEDMALASPDVLPVEEGEVRNSRGVSAIGLAGPEPQQPMARHDRWTVDDAVWRQRSGGERVMGATPTDAKLQPVIPAGNGVALALTHAERGEAMRAAICQHHVASAIAPPVDHAAHIQQSPREQGVALNLVLPGGDVPGIAQVGGHRRNSPGRPSGSPIKETKWFL